MKGLEEARIHKGDNRKLDWVVAEMREVEREGRFGRQNQWNLVTDSTWEIVVQDAPRF